MDGLKMPPPMQQPPPPPPPPPMHEWPQTKRGLPQLFYAHDGNNVVPMQGTYHPITGMSVVVPLAYISEDLRKKEAEVKEEKKWVNKLTKQVEDQKRTHDSVVKILKKQLETATKKLTDKMEDQNELVNILKTQLRNAKEDLEKLKISHVDEVKKLKAQIVDGKHELDQTEPIINAHAEEKIRLIEENKRILEENQRLLDADEKNKQMLAQWNIKREALTHIMAGTLHVDQDELSKARNTISPFMNPASLQPAPPPPPVGIKRSWPQASNGGTQDDTQPAKKK